VNGGGDSISGMPELATYVDATADYSDREMQAALDVNIPGYASAIVTTDEIVETLSHVG